MSTSATDIKSVLYKGKRYELKAPAIGSIAASQTDSQIVAAPGVGKKLVAVSGAILATTAATNFVLNSKGSGAGTAVTLTIPAGISGGINLGLAPWAECNENESLTASTGAGANVNYQIFYIVADVK